MSEQESAAARAVAQPNRRSRRVAWGVAAVALLGTAFGAGVAWQRVVISPSESGAHAKSGDEDGHDHGGSHEHTHQDDGHDHSHEDDLSLVELSKQARGNIGLKVQEIGFSEFTRTVTLPAIVVERPGQSQLNVVAPLTGVVTRINVIPGQSIAPGAILFEMRLTHEELVQAETEFLRTLEQLDVVYKEIKRLEMVAREGAIAGKVVLEREYERQKLEAELRAQSQALELHGLTAEQIESIRSDRKLLGILMVKAPASPAGGGQSTGRNLQVESLVVEQGQNVSAGEPLCKLVDHAQLYVEGQAFQQDADLLNQVARSGAAVCAVVDAANSQSDEVCNLHILYLASKVNAESRLFPFYATLPNEIVRDDQTADGRRFIGWRFRPGQRMQLKIPVESWKERIVLPVDAVIEDGPESYVFREDGDHFHRCPVQVEYRDQFSVVLAEGNDIWPGDRIAMNGAQQLYLVLKNKAGGGIDPHAGHNH